MKLTNLTPFDDLIMCEPKTTVKEFIRLFLLGDDDKIYINLYDKNQNLIFSDIRIIDSKLEDYYNDEIKYLTDEENINILCGIVLKR